MEFTINSIEQTHFDEQLYSRHLRALKLQGMSEATIDSYARAGIGVSHCIVQEDSHNYKLSANHQFMPRLRS